MAHRAIQRILAACLAALVITASALAQDYKTLVGKWNMVSESSSDPVKWTLVLKDTDGKLAAALTTEEGEQPVKDLTYTEGVLKFKVPYQGNYYDIELKATGEKGEKLDGTWSGGGDSGKTSGTKAA